MNNEIRATMKRDFQKSVCQLIANIIAISDDMREFKQFYGTIDSDSKVYISREEMQKFSDN